MQSSQHRFFALRVMFALSVIAGTVGQAAAGEPDAPIKHQNLDDDHLALKGYDAVSYFEAKAAVKGDEKYSAAYKGVTYHFASPEHMKKFKDSPTQFLPTYGGWCATAMSRGEKVDVDPTNFKITDGRLFLFYKGWLGDAKKDWDKDEAKMKTDADAAWKKIISQS